MKTTTLTNPKNGDTFESPFLTDEAAAEALNKVLLESGRPSASEEFPESLVHAEFMVRTGRWKGGLSEGRRFWLHKIAAERSGLVARPQPDPTLTVDAGSILEMFGKAGETLKRPAIRLRTTGLGGFPVRFSVAGARAKKPGSINVADPEWGGPYYGSIDPETGHYFATRSTPAEVKELVAAFADDPAAVAAAFGKLSGNCCFCSRELSDERSTSVGYGPVCAERYGLPWGG